MDEAVAALFESARKSEKSAPRKHHLVPASYLVRWEVEGLLRVTETDTKKSYLNSAENACGVHKLDFADDQGSCTPIGIEYHHWCYRVSTLVPWLGSDWSADASCACRKSHPAR